MTTVRNVLFGFIAGALAVLVFHQGMYWLIANYGGPYGLTLRGQPWRWTEQAQFMPDLLKALKYSPQQVPYLANQMFWGGLWGALFGLLVNRLPGGAIPVKAFIFAMIGPMLIGSWLLLPLMATPPRPILNGFLNGYNVKVLATGFLLNGVAFGIGLGVFFSLMRGMGLVPSHRAEHAY